MSMRDPRILRNVIREMYGLNLIDFLYLNEQAADPAATPEDPAAAAAAPPAAADPAVADAAAIVPPTDPAAASALPAADPAADPAAGAPLPADQDTGTDPVAKAEDVKKVNPDQLQDPIERFLVNAEQRAMKTDLATESLRRRSLRFILEAEGADEPKLDMEIYAAEIARLIKNYTNLVDVKGNVIKRAQDYIREKYPKSGIAYTEELLNLLKRHYDISLDRPESPPDAYAVGAGTGGAAAT